MKTIASILTPLGEGGIGVVGLLGPQAIAVANGCFRGTRVKDLRELPSGRICHGFIHDENGPADEVIVHVSHGETPESDFIEINCHGGIVPVRKVLALCLRQGATEAAPDEFLAHLSRLPGRNAPLGRLYDSIQREALLCLPKARTTLAALVLLEQVHGALSNALRSCVERLQNLSRADNPRKVVEDVAAETQRLIENARFGLALTQPRHLVVVGKPNVGKSTLVNALLAEDRVLVHHLPGTTRDAVATMVEISGVPFELVDTAGIRESGHELEMLGMEQTWREVAAADLILLLLDASRPLDINDAHILSVLAGRNVIFVVTKCDLPPYFNLDVLRNAAKAPLCEMSAPSGEGLDTLCQAILSRVGFKPRTESEKKQIWNPPSLKLRRASEASGEGGSGTQEKEQQRNKQISECAEPGDPGQAVPFTEAQAQALQQAADIFKECPAPDSPRIGKAIEALRDLFGERA